ncbi:MAG: hypothetical protein RJA98_3908 [Pseudomonadota bacterium]
MTHPSSLWTRLRTAATLAGLALASASPAWAADPVLGATRYANSCASCHGSSPLTSNGSKIFNGRNSASAIDSAISGNTGGMGSLRSAFPVGGAAIADVAAYLGNAPSTLTFASTNVGSTSATQTVTVRASSKAGQGISSLVITPSGDFSRSGGTCATTVAVGTSCTVIVAFTPTAAGARTGTLSIAHNGLTTPALIALSGTGAGTVATPIAALAPGALSFASTAVGSTSAQQSTTLSNSGTGPLTIGTITRTGTDFTIAGGTCAAGGTVAAGSSCTVALAFAPAATGARTGSVAITHNASGGTATVSLSGTATAAAAPAAALSASTLSFGSLTVGSTSSGQSLTLSNSGTAALTLGTLSTGSSDYAISGGSCAAGGTVAAGASCTVALTFTPTAAGARSATLTVTHNASGGSSTAGLSGTGVAATPVIGVSPSALSFSQVVGSRSAASTVTISNSGTAALTLGTFTFTGAQASDFALGSSNTCTAGGNVAASSSCALSVTFLPTASGARSASLVITHNASGASSTITLSGTGTAAPQPTVSLNSSALTFGAAVVGSSSATQTVTVSNSGSAALSFTGFTLTGASGDYTRSGSCSTASALAAGSSCTVVLGFTPTATGTRSATLTIASNASNGSAAIALSGTGNALPVPAVSLSPASLDFGNQSIGVASAARSITLSNSGSGALAISALGTSAPYALTHNCGASVAAGASCTVNVVFTPNGAGAANGNVTLATNASGSPHAVTLSGTGLLALPALSWSSASALAFGTVTVGQSSATVSRTLSNAGPGSATLTALPISGSEAGDFAVAAGSSCSASTVLAAGSSCTLVLSFSPAAAGSRSASLQVSSNGSNPGALSLSGTGAAAASAAVSTTPTSLSLQMDATASSSAPQTLLISNSGSAVLNVSGYAIATGAFSVAPAASNGCPAAPFVLQPGQSCALNVTWTSATDTSASGSVQITTDASATPLDVPVLATRSSVSNTGESGSGSADNSADNTVGGCAIASGQSAVDPLLWLLVVAAIGVLWRRRRHD